MNPKTDSKAEKGVPGPLPVRGAEARLCDRPVVAEVEIPRFNAGLNGVVARKAWATRLHNEAARKAGKGGKNVAFLS